MDNCVVSYFQDTNTNTAQLMCIFYVSKWIIVHTCQQIYCIPQTIKEVSSLLRERMDMSSLVCNDTSSSSSISLYKFGSYIKTTVKPASNRISKI